MKKINNFSRKTVNVLKKIGKGFAFVAYIALNVATLKPTNSQEMVQFYEALTDKKISPMERDCIRTPNGVACA